VQLDDAVDLPGLQPHAAVAVTQRVVDEVPERLLEADPVAQDAHAGAGRDRLHRPAGLLRAPLEAAGDGGEQLGSGQRLHPQRQPPAVGAGDQQQVVGEPGEPVDLLRGPADRLAELVLRLRVAQRQLELRAQQRERRTQLVARVGDEVALAAEGGLQAAEHLVQGLAQPLDLVPRLRHREPLARGLRGDRRRPPPHPLDRAQRGAGEQVARRGGQDERDRTGDQQLVPEARERLPVVLARGADDEHEAPAVATDRRREQPRGLVQAGRPGAVAERRPASRGCQLVGRQQRRGPERRRRLKHPAPPVEELRVALAALDQVAGLGHVDRRARIAHERGEILRVQPQVAVERKREM
jgi:hypothetical protein